MLSKLQRIQKIADKFAYKYLCTAMTKQDIKEFHWCAELANVDYMDIMDYMQGYEVDYIDGNWIIIRPTGGVIECLK